MMKVADSDKDVLRFLWVDDVTSEEPTIVVKRFNRVVFGVTSSPFLLNGTVRHHVTSYESEDPQFVKEFLSSLYVEDFNGGKDSVSEAFQLYLKAKSLLQVGGFNLRKWLSNSMELNQKIDQEERVPIMEAPPVSEEDSTYARTHFECHAPVGANGRTILGLEWESTEDNFVLHLDWLVQFAKELPDTKRSVLKVVAKVYDPLGLISPLFTTIKVLFQELCKLKVDWDVPLSEETTLKYSNWLVDLLRIKSIPINRCYFQNSESLISLQIHGFGDSSDVAYAAVVYLRIKTASGTSSQLVISKTRVAPL